MKNCFDLFKYYGPKVLFVSGIKEIHRLFWRQTIKGSYSQNYEDLIIEKLINMKNGRYLEIGAYHPTRLSNTYRFYKQGWSGVVVEPNPDIIELFSRLRPRDNFRNIGIANKKGKLNYYKFLIPALNTFSKSALTNGHRIKEIQQIKVDKVTSVVNENFDFLSLDTEGFDKLILRNWPWGKYRPKVICVEDDVQSILEPRGYIEVARTKDNTIFVYQK